MWENAKVDYMNGMKYKDIATKYNVSISTVKSWKVRYKWDRKSTRTKTEKVCVQNEKSTHTKLKKRGARPGNNNAVGHGAPLANQNARKHGFFSKYLPAEMFQIITDIDQVSAIDILWSNITIAYAKIIHSQKVMFVKDNDDFTERVTQVSSSDSGDSTSKSYLEAIEKQALDLNASARMMATLNAMIKQYDELCRSDLVTEEQRLRIEKLKADIKDKSGDVDNEDASGEDGFKSALLGQVKNVWGDDE